MPNTTPVLNWSNTKSYEKLVVNSPVAIIDNTNAGASVNK